MPIEFFGQFLLKKRVVSRKTVLKACALQKASNQKVGRIAIKMGYLNEEDVERIHEAQRSTDLPFCDLAVALDLLNPRQAREVLTWQKNHHLYIGEAIRRVSGMSEEDLEGYLQEFENAQAPCVVTEDALPEGVSQPQLWETAVDLTRKMLIRIADISFRPGPCQTIEFLSANDVLAIASVSGSASGHYLLSASSQVQQAITRGILKEEDVGRKPVEALGDTVGVFVQTILESLAATSAKRHLPLEVAPPETHHPTKGIAVPPDHLGLLFPLHLGDGDRIDLALFIRQ